MLIIQTLIQLRTNYSQALEKLVRWRLCYFFPSSDEQLSISDTLNDFLKPKNLSCKTLVRRRLFLIGKKVSKFKATTCRVD